MRSYLVFVALLVCNLSFARSLRSREEDGFHRLLRRSAASAEFDRPLVREERASEEDFENDDDDFVTRNRRSNEDKFYQTLLSRSESKQPDKRSFDTDDTDNKAGFIVREDWTGDSKISDADRQELENLFSTLNPSDDEEVKNEKVRDIKIEDEPESVSGAAKDYTKWLMAQDPSKFTKSLTHKIEVDHELSKLFYKSSLPNAAAQKNPVIRSAPSPKKKAVAKKPAAKKAAAKNVKANARENIAAAISKLPALCSDNTKECMCKKACAPRPVTSTAPCNCGAAAAAPAVATNPAAARRTAPQRAPFVVNSRSAKPCGKDDAKCLCARACYPNPVANANPCDCGMPAPAPPPPPAPAAAKFSPRAPAAAATAKSKTPSCGKNDAKCLCARACYPRPVAKTKPCDCGMPAPAPAPAPPPSSAIPAVSPKAAASSACAPTDAQCLCAKSCHPRPVAKASPCDCGMPAPAPAPAPAPPPSSAIPAVNPKAAASSACAPTDAQCLCAKSCHPRPVAKASPCDCGMPAPAPAPAPAPPPSSAIPAATSPACAPTDAHCLCAKSCHPRPVTKASPCDCGMPAPAPPPAPPPAPVAATTNKAPFTCKAGDANCICARACYPRPVSKASPCNCGMPPPPPPPPSPAPPPAKIAVPAPAVATQANTKTYSPAIAWCTKACKPRHVLSTSPCQCHPGEPVAFAPRQPRPLPKAKDTTDTLCERTCHPRPVSSSNPCECGIPAEGDTKHMYPISAPIAPETALQFPGPPSAAFQPIPQAASNGLSQAPARSSVAKKGKAHKKQVQSAISKKPAPEETEDVYYSRTTGEKLNYLDTRAKNYQGCYKDKKPGRDLPRRFTRYAMTPEVCVRECKYQGYNFAGLQYAYLCFCGNAFGRYGKVDDAYCNSRCLGDQTRPCGAFWHNSVYSTDGKDYGKSEFDFHKIDAEEAKKDEVAVKQGFDPNKFSSTTKATVANNLVKAAEAALKAAKKLLPDSKSKIFSKNGKHKREDDEDPELEEMKMSAMASLGAARKLMRKTPLVDPSKHKQKEKRSIETGDGDWVDLDNGKDLLVAYLGGIADYRRQIRSVDDDDDDDFQSDDSKPKFEYKRMALGASGDGEFIEKYEDDALKTDDRSKRSVSDNDVVSEVRKPLLPIKIVKRSTGHAKKKSHAKKRQQVPAVARNPQELEAMNATAPSNETLPPTNATLPATNQTSSNESLIDSISRHVTPEISTAASTPANTTSVENSSLAKNTTAPKDAKAAVEGKKEPLNSVAVKAEKSFSIRKRRSLEDEEEVDGVKKMAARGEHVDTDNKIPPIKREAGEEEDDSTETDFARLLSEETKAEKMTERHLKRSSRGSEDGAEEDYIPTNVEKEAEVDKRSAEDKKDYTQLRSHVEKGVERLMNLVVNLYKEQSTIKGFEDSVRSLKDDIATHLKSSPKKKDETMRELRSEIQKTAAAKLEELTTSIRGEIKDYAKSHPDATKRASTAITSIPDLPVSDAQYARARREISKRAAELDDVTEDSFKAQGVPEILKQHFKRNAENEFKGEKMLSRNHRNVPEDETLDDELKEIVEN